MSPAVLELPERPIETHPPEEHHEHRRGFIRTYVFSTDHKVIGIQYIVTGLVMALLGAALAVLIRLQLGWPGHRWELLSYLLPAGMPERRDGAGVLPGSCSWATSC